MCWRGLGGPLLNTRSQPCLRGASLSAAEVAEFAVLLGQLSGTKESIRNAKDWLLEHAASPASAQRCLAQALPTTPRPFVSYLMVVPFLWKSGRGALHGMMPLEHQGTTM